MGLICNCRVVVDGLSKDNNVKFAGVKCKIKGDLQYMANACDNNLSASFLTLHFTDRSGNAVNRSFEFVARTITSVECREICQNCEVTVTGTGTVGENIYPFVAVFRDQVATSNKDTVQSFVITRFFDQNGPATVPQGSIVAVGCV
ncbi:hypothetical protein QTL97_00780 [Sporosarcina thermotolerans]|uniref:Uncharacterized protein n=1 Tax=Sporosarcina thermotolerans TaxID=633404 RepID=A0AAW9A3P0_9BACL|nr:hypothetical protein [Sporosarcina thermotolerans]MDW0115472.1 hypothetical protein [Sporosarcina thermotolerans]WHT47203.1 hypothetical protein QNH10_13260 [Sporosarcina thermotolerans]